MYGRIEIKPCIEDKVRRREIRIPCRQVLYEEGVGREGYRVPRNFDQNPWPVSDIFVGVDSWERTQSDIFHNYPHLTTFELYLRAIGSSIPYAVRIGDHVSAWGATIDDVEIGFKSRSDCDRTGFRSLIRVKLLKQVEAQRNL
jgi:hypothetical protein